MLNKMVLQGRLTADTEMSNTPNGIEVVKFTVAWSKKYKETETKLFLNCVAWRQTGVFINKYFKKGQEIVVEGTLSSRGYEDKQGNKRTAFELTVEQAHFCGSKADSNTNISAPAQSNFTAENFEDIDTDDSNLPF